MSFSLSLSVLVVLAAAVAPTVPVDAPMAPIAEKAPEGAKRLALEGIGIGDSEGRLITLMPTAACSTVEGDPSLADRWCRIPDQRVLGVLPQGLMVTLRADRIESVVARMPARTWTLLRARLIEAFGEPDRRVAPLSLVDAGDEAADAREQLQWLRADAVLELVPGSNGGDHVLSLGVRRTP